VMACAEMLRKAMFLKSAWKSEGGGGRPEMGPVAPATTESRRRRGHGRGDEALTPRASTGPLPVSKTSTGRAQVHPAMGPNRPSAQHGTDWAANDPAPDRHGEA
jgi:hypothetical protein